MTDEPKGSITYGRCLAAALDLQPLPQEGGLYRRTLAADKRSVILFMLVGTDFSALHRLTTTELYVFQAGAPLRMLIIDDDGPREVIVGLDVTAGHQPQFLVSPGCWQGSSSAGSWTLLTTVVTPPFEWSMFELAQRSELQRQWPPAAERIAELTRPPPALRP